MQIPIQIGASLELYILTSVWFCDLNSLCDFLYYLIRKHVNVHSISFNVRSMFVQRSFNVCLHSTTLVHSVVVLTTLMCVPVASFVCVR